MTETRVAIRPRYGEVDSMGIVYHAHYLVYFDIGRTEAMRARGMPYSEVEAKGYQLAVVAADVRYRQPARYDEALDLRTQIHEIGKASVTFTYALHGEDGRLLATGSTRLGCLSEGRKPTLLPAELRAALESEPLDQGRMSHPAASEEA